MPDSHPTPVMLREEPGADSGALGELADEAARAARDLPDGALGLARAWAARLPLPGRGATLGLWEALATLGAVDLSVARVLEPHLDALAILAESGSTETPDGSTWGVFAAEGPGVRLSAAPDDKHDRRGWVLDGTKPWCSLGGHLSHALVTAWVDDARRGLFAVDLRQPGVRAHPDAWHARGLTAVSSGPLDLAAATATAVGEPGWYLERNGFAWGGIGVAAVWYGAAVAVARRLLAQTQRRTPDQVALAALGRVDTLLVPARAVLRDAARQVDAGTADGAAGALLAARARGVVAGAAEQVLTTVGHALGPGPLAVEAEHAARVADLTLYLRQHHAERDDAALGGQLAEGSAAGVLPW